MAAVEIGIEAQWQHYNWLRNVFGDNPMVLLAEDVQANPVGTMGQFWKAAGLSFCEEAFSWQTGDVPEDWQGLVGWHGDVSASNSINPPDPTENAVANFHKAAKSAPQLQRYLDQHMPYYQQLHAHALGSGP